MGHHEFWAYSQVLVEPVEPQVQEYPISVIPSTVAGQPQEGILHQLGFKGLRAEASLMNAIKTRQTANSRIAAFLLMTPSLQSRRPPPVLAGGK